MPYKDPEKQLEYQRQWIANRRAEYLKDKKCVKADNSCAGPLEVDHVDPSKKWTHRIWSYCKAKRDAELAKCQILCQKHHMEKTVASIIKMRTASHGTQEGYNKWHCRCDACMKFFQTSPDQYDAGISLDIAKGLVLA